MRRRLSVTLAIAVAAGVQPVITTPAAAATSEVVVACRSSNVQCWPAAFAFSRTGAIFYAERYTGQIRTYSPSTGRHRRWAQLRDIAGSGEQGVLGIALDPRWKRARRYRWVYVYFTKGSPLENRIVRLRKRSDGSLIRQRLARIPAAATHNAGPLAFGRDGMLYALTGDAGTPARSQDLTTLAGKVLRMTKGGNTPSDNPVLGGRRRRIWSYGHRNTFGFAFDPGTSRLWQTENGPNCNDEINRIRRGGNFGWGPSASCPNTNNSGPEPRIGPEFNIASPTAPTGAAFCKGCNLPDQEGRLLYGVYKSGEIRSLALADERRTIDGSSDAQVYDHVRGVLTLQRRGTGIYFSDERGIHRLVP